MRNFMKHLKFLLICVLLIFVFITGGQATTITDYGTTSPGADYSSSGSRNPVSGFRVVVLDNAGNIVTGTTRLTVVDHKDTATDTVKNWANNTYITSNQYSKVEYIKKSEISKRTDFTVKRTDTTVKHWSTISGLEELTDFISNDNKIKDREVANYLKDNSFKNLKALLVAAGYTCATSTPSSSQCAGKNSHYVVVEPMTVINKRLGTAFELAGYSWFAPGKEPTGTGDAYKAAYSAACPTGNCWYGKVFITLHNALYISQNATFFGTIVGNNSSTNSQKTSFNNINQNKGVAISIYKISDVSPIPQKGHIKITKKNSVTQAGIQNVGFEVYTGSGCTGTKVKSELKTNSSGEVTFTELDPGTYYVYESTVPSGYVTPANRCTSVIVTAGATATVSITNEPKGGFKIKKTNSTLDPVLSGLSSSTDFEFELYSNSNCTGEALKTNISPGDEVKNLLPDTYYLKETQVKNGYHLPLSGEPEYCVAVTVSAGTIAEKAITNKTECEYRFKSNMTMSQRINLYNDIKNLYSQNYNELLDMANTTFATACRNSIPETGYDVSCLSATTQSKNNAFSATNLSNYNEQLDSYTFCKTEYKIDNNLKQSYFGGVKSGRPIVSDSGSIATAELKRVCYNYDISDLYIESLNYNDYIGDVTIAGHKMDESSGTLVETRYDISSGTNVGGFKTTKFNVSDNSLITADAHFSLYDGFDCLYGDIVYGKYKYDGDPRVYTPNSPSPNYLLIVQNENGKLNLIPVAHANNISSNSFGMFEKTADDSVISPYYSEFTQSNRCTNVRVNSTLEYREFWQVAKVGYMLPTMYASNKDGRVYYGSCPSGEVCKYLTRGIASIFNENPGIKEFTFDVEIKKGFGSKGTTSTCKYEVENQLIDTGSDVKLEFRPVITDMQQAFLKKGANSVSDVRVPGLNWSSFSVRRDVLNLRNDSHNKNNTNPMYEITLTPSDIKAIREYNKLTSYDDYTLSCDSGGNNCSSNFLTRLKEGILKYPANGKTYTNSWDLDNILQTN